MSAVILDLKCDCGLLLRPVIVSKELTHIRRTCSGCGRRFAIRIKRGPTATYARFPKGSVTYWQRWRCTSPRAGRPTIGRAAVVTLPPAALRTRAIRQRRA